MIPFPNISPEIFSISVGGVEVALRWYAVSYIAGFVVAIYIMRFFIKKEHLWNHKTPPMDPIQVDTLITYLILGVIIGGRLGYVFFYNFGFFMEQPISIIRIWDGGMSFHGGFFGVVLAVIFYCRFNGIPLLSGSDLIALATPPGLLFGRLANFINAELWGRPTNSFFGVVFPGERAQYCPGFTEPCARHPSQLYEAGLEGLLLFFILICLPFVGCLKRPGFITGVFLIGYAASRFLVEFFREADPQFMSPENPLGYVYSIGALGLTMGQLLSFPLLILGIFFMLKSFTRG